MSEKSPDSDGDDNPYNDTTSNTMTRWKYIGTALAGMMVLSLPVVIIGTALGTFTVTGIPQAWFGLYFLVTMMAATWAFGKETLEAVNKARGQ